MIKQEYIPSLPQIPYRKGYGQYEGIVLHSTAVFNDTAERERTFESSTYQSAFVHAFSDSKGTIETADPNYISWGAGHVANYRYLNSELCQVRNDGSQAATDDFQASYGNWIEYAATKLYERKLGVTAARPDGLGTCWQHWNVSQWLGDSDHVDPMDYLVTWGVTWEQVIADIQTKYGELAQVDELLKKIEELSGKIGVLETAAANIAAPDWFVKELGSADLGGLISEPSKPELYWEAVATILRAVGWKPAA